jgi:hypothetical protein
MLLNRDKIMQTKTALARPALESRSFCAHCADAPHRWLCAAGARFGEINRNFIC